MPTLSSGINLALQAVLTHAQAIEIIEHNVANANTPGYRRQSAALVTTAPTPSMGMDSGVGAGQRGTGVTIEKIQRFSLDFFDDRFRTISAQTKSLENQRDLLVQVESTLSETSDDSLLSKMDEFWSGWQRLAADPTNSSLRSAVLINAGELSSAFNQRAQQLTAIRQDQNLAVINRVDEINTIGSQIAGLNAEISKVNSIGEQPNDLMDKRDLLLDRLSQISGAVSYPQENGEVIVSIGGHVLVTGHDALTLKTGPDPDNTDVVRILWEKDSDSFTPRGGEIEGILKVRDDFIPQQISGLNELANKMINQVNSLHQKGFDTTGQPGEALFTGDDAFSIAVNSNITTEKLAVSDAAGISGNNAIAKAISELRYQKILGANTQTMNDYYNAQVTGLGLVVKQAKDGSYQHGLVLDALSAQRESAGGVSLDEEAADLAKYQRAYQAAARVMTTYDEMLDRIINSMGLVGR